jgi:hypothetical protein
MKKRELNIPGKYLAMFGVMIIFICLVIPFFNDNNSSDNSEEWRVEQFNSSVDYEGFRAYAYISDMLYDNCLHVGIKDAYDYKRYVRVLGKFSPRKPGQSSDDIEVTFFQMEKTIFDEDDPLFKFTDYDEMKKVYEYLKERRIIEKLIKYHERKGT